MPIRPLQFQQIILAWYDQHGRKDLPWQQNISAYRVWLSEIMLQQTQVATVIPYFEKFIAKFPNVEVLASSHLDEVLHLWSGLGYYSRARNLHRCAQIIKEEYFGKFPDDVESLQTLPGIGRSTAGAIVSLAYAKPAPILDGNVKRVLTRFHGIHGWPSDLNISKQLWEIAGNYVPEQQARPYTQAMMDLGAMICTRSKPQCHLCPLQQGCQAYIRNEQKILPTKKPKKSIPTQQKYFFLLQTKNELLLEKRLPMGIWGGLWSLPECHIEQNIALWCQQQYGLNIDKYEILPTFRHTFSHFHLDIAPILITIQEKPSIIMDSSERVWYKIEEINTLGLPAPIKKLLKSLNLHPEVFSCPE